ncbi:extracellular solute-binding protein [Paenibacillus sp. MBLB4367]|uniref:extracellular solute-binding protein n=1 Tax=Paenibacillus sp. MBLB4367 TaxID=3384767 RepID=UPI003908426F
MKQCISTISKAAMIASLALTAVISGCSTDKGGTTGETSKPTTRPSAGQSVQPKASEEAGKGGKYDPPIELTTVNFTYNASAKYASGDDLNNNAWSRYLKDQLGVTVKTLWEVPLAELEQKTNLMIASRDIPDFFLATPTQLVQLEKAGLIEDLTNVYKNNAPENVKKLVEEAGKEVVESATIKGKLMGLPFTGVSKESVPVLWVREDWMKKLNLPAPKTLQDVFAIAEAFATKDPDGNGKNDTFGYALDKDLGQTVGLMNGFHAYKSMWIKDAGGQLAYSSIQPEMKTALAKLQEMYKANLIDKEFGVKNMGKVNENIGASQIGMFYGTMNNGISPLANNLSKDAKWIPYPVPSIDAKPALLQHPLNINYGYWVVKKGTKNPEAVLKMAEEWIKLFYLNSSDDLFKKYNYDKDTKISYWMNAPVKMFKSFKNAEISVHLESLLKSGAAATADQLAKLTPEEREEYDSIQKFKKGDMSLWGWASRSDLGGSGSIITGYGKNNQFLADQFFGTPTQAMVQKQANLNKLELETFTKIILGDSLDTFDSFVTQWKKQGGDEITQEVNDWFKNK